MRFPTAAGQICKSPGTYTKCVSPGFDACTFRSLCSSAEHLGSLRTLQTSPPAQVPDHSPFQSGFSAKRQVSVSTEIPRHRKTIGNCCRVNVRASSCQPNVYHLAHGQKRDLHATVRPRLSCLHKCGIVHSSSQKQLGVHYETMILFWALVSGPPAHGHDEPHAVPGDARQTHERY